MKEIIRRAKIYFLFAILTLFNIQCSQEYRLQLCIEGVKYDSITFIGKKAGDNDTQFYFIKGTSHDSKNWSFVFPDSIYNSVIYFRIIYKNQDSDLNDQYDIRLNTIQNGDTLFNGGALFLDRKIKKIDMQFLETETENDVLFYRYGTEFNEENIFRGNTHNDQFLIPFYSNNDFILQFTEVWFGKFVSPEDNEPTYNEYLDQYLKTIEKYPDSKYLISYVLWGLEFYRTKSDLQKLYFAFSKENQNSYFGKLIADYIEHFYLFSNMKLPNSNTGDMEFVIQDSTRMNLIVFSASWCEPCHELIPILKEIYSDLKDRLDFTYISMDEKKTANSWRKLLQDKDIPWRSLMAENEIDEVKLMYNPGGNIPLALLVYPDKTIDKIYLWDNVQREKLYSICKGE